MRTITLTLLGAAAIAAVSIGGASAMPFSSGPAALGESHVQDVRLVCDRFGRCYNTNRGAYRSRHYNSGRYHSQRRYRGYDRGPRVGIGIGPVGIGIRTW